MLKYVKAKFDGEPPVHAICHATVAHAKKTIKEMRLKGLLHNSIPRNNERRLDWQFMGKIRNLIIDAGTALLWGFMFRRNSGRRWADEFSDAQICRRVCEHRPPLQRLVSQKCFCGVGWDQTEEKHNKI